MESWSLPEAFCGSFICAKSLDGSHISVTEVGNNGAKDVANCFVRDCEPLRNLELYQF